MTDTSTEHDDRRLATIRALLAKAEATEFPDEAEAFFAKASELISRWAIDEAMLWAGATGQREQPEELRLVLHAPYITQKSVLVGAVGRAHGCRTVRLGAGSGSRTQVLSVVGFPSDLRWVETLTTSLLLQLTSAMLAKCPRGVTAAESASWRRSFIMGFADEVADRLERDRRAAAAEQQASGADGGGAGAAGSSGARPSVEVVLASRAHEVDEQFRRLHPYVRSTWASRGRSASGRSAGRRAGREASLSRHGLAGRRALGRG